MKINLGKTVLRINISFAAAVTLTLILDESGMCAVSLFCCIVHETGHLISLAVFGEKPGLIELSFYGIKLERKSDRERKLIEEIIIYASGPAANLVLWALLFFLGRTDGMKTAAAISLFVGLFNLVPCRPLDGGNILGIILERLTDWEKSERIGFFAACGIIAPMAAAGVTVFVKSGNLTLLAVSIYLALITAFDKKEKGIKI